MGYGNTEVFLSAKEREELIKAYMGKTVEVVIDRPIGYHHVTKDVPLDYTVNYGYIPGVMGGDGDEQDVYVLGVDVPLERFTGRIIGAIRRRDDNEDKLVAAPAGMRFHQGQIAEAVRFVEQYFDSTIDCLYRKSCGVIPWRRRDLGPPSCRTTGRSSPTGSSPSAPRMWCCFWGKLRETSGRHREKLSGTAGSPPKKPRSSSGATIWG